MESAESSSPAQLSVQARRNAELRDAWELFESHRRIVTGILTQAAPSQSGSLGILGAGNCNDLDLTAILGTFREVQLVDWDAAALETGRQSQGLAESLALQLHGGVELSGIAHVVASFSRERPPTEQQWRDLIETATNAPLPLRKNSLDVAASVCLLSQILEPISALAASDSPAWLALIAAVRRRHLAMLTEMVRPGGNTVFITDIVSSESAPELLTTTDNNLPTLLSRLLQASNFFTGLNPAVILNTLRTDPVFNETVHDPQPLTPWKWCFGKRVYAVYGIRWARK